MGHDGEQPLLERIHTGMTVFDREGEELGAVDAVFLGPPRLPGEESSPEVGEADEPAGSQPDRLGDFPVPPGTPPPVAAADEAMEETLRTPELRAGYIRVTNQDLSDTQRLIARQDIERLDDWRVVLRVTRAELAER